MAQFFWYAALAVRWFEGAFEPTRRGLRTAMLAMLWIGVAGHRVPVHANCGSISARQVETGWGG